MWSRYVRRRLERRGLAGRESAIEALDDGRIQRRGGHPSREAQLMAHAAAHGVKVPRVFEVHEDALILERVDGPTMDEALWERPWTFRSQARVRANLHRQIAAASLCHLDLHPANVILSPAGLVVIDWTNAVREDDPAVDAALTYLILATNCGLGGRAIAWFFGRYIDVWGGLERAAAFRLADKNLTDGERVSVQQFVEHTLSRRR